MIKIGAISPFWRYKSTPVAYKRGISYCRHSAWSLMPNPNLICKYWLHSKAYQWVQFPPDLWCQNPAWFANTGSSDLGDPLRWCPSAWCTAWAVWTACFATESWWSSIAWRGYVGLLHASHAPAQQHSNVSLLEFHMHCTCNSVSELKSLLYFHCVKTFAALLHACHMPPHPQDKVSLLNNTHALHMQITGGV